MRVILEGTPDEIEEFLEKREIIDVIDDIHAEQISLKKQLSLMGDRIADPLEMFEGVVKFGKLSQREKEKILKIIKEERNKNKNGD